MKIFKFDSIVTLLTCRAPFIGQPLIKIFLLCLYCYISSAKAEIVSCKDYLGNTIFTDNRALCVLSGEEQDATDINEVKLAKPIEAINKQACGKQVKNKHKVDYCTPRREYYKTGDSWTIYLEQSLVDSDKPYADKALNKLETNLNEIIAKLPRHAAQQLKKLDVYLMKGEKSGVDEGGMSYIRPGEAKNYHYLDPSWQHAIVVYSAKTLMYLDKMWTQKALMHELAHAWHISKWPQRHPPIYSAFLQAKKKGLYTNIKDYKGRNIEVAYAIKNQLEYFADLSAMYFVGGNYFPYKAEKLKEYDPVGYRMVKLMWSE